MLDPSILFSPIAAPENLFPAIVSPRDQANRAESQTRALATVIELLSRLDASARLDDAAHEAARLLCGVVSADQVMVLWRKRSTASLKLIGNSDPGVVQSENLIIAAAEEVSIRGEITIWPTDQPLDRHALLAVSQLAQALSASSMRGIRLTDVTGDRGVLLAINVAMDQRSSYLATNTLSTIAAPLASKLASLERLQPNALENFLRGIISGIRGAKRRVVLAISILIGIVLLLPIRYTVKAKVEIQPIQHRYVAVPFDGPLEVAHVRPGDIVQKGQLLARLNPREVDYELASLRAELNQSLQEQKRLVATHDFAGSKIAALESERLDLQTQLLQFHHDNLEIRSPIEGIVVSGDWKQSEGMPMSRGETLFEIAPLGRMVVEIAVPESDIAHVREGMPAKFYVESLPNRTMASVIGRVHPRAELKDHENSFIAEIVIDDPENLLRPGMRGRARISSDRHPLGWNLFHQAYFTLCKLVRW